MHTPEGSGFYAAIINVPGYLPDSDTPPPLFKTAKEAIAYLIEERKSLFKDAELDASNDLTLQAMHAIHNVDYDGTTPLTPTWQAALPTSDPWQYDLAYEVHWIPGFAFLMDFTMGELHDLIRSEYEAYEEDGGVSGMTPDQVDDLLTMKHAEYSLVEAAMALAVHNEGDPQKYVNVPVSEAFRDARSDYLEDEEVYETIVDLLLDKE